MGILFDVNGKLPAADVGSLVEEHGLKSAVLRMPALTSMPSSIKSCLLPQNPLRLRT